VVNENLIAFFRQKSDAFPFARPIDLERFLVDNLDDPAALFPIPAKIFLVDEVRPHALGFAVTRAAALDDLESRLTRWLDDEMAARLSGGQPKRAEESLLGYRNAAIRLAENALQSSILADYHAVFWLVHSGQVAHLFSSLPRRAMSASPTLNREASDTLKYTLFARWIVSMREGLPEVSSDERRLRFVRLLFDNPLVSTEEHVSSDFRELRGYFAGQVRRDFSAFKKAFDEMRSRAAELMSRDRLFRRALVQLGYPDSPPSMTALCDRRVQQLILDHPGTTPWADGQFVEILSRRLIEFNIVHLLRRAVVWMTPTKEGDNVGDEHGKKTIYSRAIRPMDFGRRGIVEPIVYRYGLVYDITSFTQTLGEVQRAGKQDEQTSYRQMLEFQKQLADVAARNAQQFEKFLGDGAFYTSRRATRSLNAAIEIQQQYAAMRRAGFAFNKGMRIALNYGYYRLLPMQVSTDGAEIKEFYGPGIVELSRLTTGKATKEIEDIQHLLLSHGYEQMEVLRFFAPLSRSAGTDEEMLQHREFYAYVDQNGHLINEGIVASVPFLQQLAEELVEDEQKLYRLRTKWSSYVGMASAAEHGTYIGLRLLGSVSLKGIGMVEVAEIVRLTSEEAEVSMIEDTRPLLQLLQQERNRSSARLRDGDDDTSAGSDLVVCESHGQDDAPAVIYVGEWDPVAEEVRRPIQLGGEEAERLGLELPITMQAIESQSRAYQKLYRKLARLETLPNFSVSAIRENQNFSAFVIGDTVERL
jgi:hypothetical protein